MGGRGAGSCGLLTTKMNLTGSYLKRGIAGMLASSMIISCAGPNRPAPVVVLNSQHYPKVEEKLAKYTVKAGDTLYAIAWYTGHDYRDIAKWNSLAEPYSIYPSQTLDLRPPRTVSKKTHSVNNMTGQTRKKNVKVSIDQRDSQAYCGVKCEAVVNNPKQVTGKPPKNGFPHRVEKWIWPAEGRVQISKDSGQTNQTGVDIYSVQGSKIGAAAAGKVVYAGNALRGYGNLIIIKHTDSFLSAYAHNDRIMVSERDWVKAGQEIAKMGSTGSTTVKLHFEIRYRGKAVEPLKYLPKKQ